MMDKIERMIEQGATPEQVTSALLAENAALTAALSATVEKRDGYLNELKSVEALSECRLEQRDGLLSMLEKVTAKLAWLNSDDCGHIMALTDEAKALIASVKGGA